LKDTRVINRNAIIQGDDLLETHLVISYISPPVN